MRKLNNSGYLLITEFEGYSAKPYLCSAKVPTIGYGNTYYTDGKRVTMLDKEINKQQAFEMFKVIADRFASKVSNLVKTPLNQNQFNSCVSLAYNIGMANFMNSTLLKLVNKNHNDILIGLEFKKWNKVNKKVVAGLTRRRNYESDIYFS
jgi:lysozyme